MLANIWLFEGKTDESIQIFTDLLKQQPENYKALSKLIHLFRRVGEIEKCKEFIELAERRATNKAAAGLNFVWGMFKRFSMDPQGALRELNKARRDGFYGVDSMVLMIEIYLNPMDELLFSCQNKNVTYETSADNLKAAEALI